VSHVSTVCRFLLEGGQAFFPDTFQIADAIRAENEAEELGYQVVDLFAFPKVCELVAFGACGVSSSHGTRFHLAVAVHGFVAVTALASILEICAAVAAYEAAVGDNGFLCGVGHGSLQSLSNTLML
jgi:hypothetical protein